MRMCESKQRSRSNETEIFFLTFFVTAAQECRCCACTCAFLRRAPVILPHTGVQERVSEEDGGGGAGHQCTPAEGGRRYQVMREGAGGVSLQTSLPLSVDQVRP